MRSKISHLPNKLITNQGCNEIGGGPRIGCINEKIDGVFFGCILLQRMTTEKTPNENTFYVCQTCEFSSLKYSDFERHISTNKHNINNINIINPKIKPYDRNCDECGRHFTNRATLYNHMKICNVNEKIIPSINNNTVMDILRELISQNAEFKRELISQNAEFKRELISQNAEFKEYVQLLINTNDELYKNIIKKLGYNNNKHTNKHTNKTFDVHAHLSEKCNSAMDITEFVNSIVLNVADLERVGSVGYVEGISDIFITAINKIDVCNRPVHCTNAKMEIIFIKNGDSWIVDKNNDNIRSVIKHITKLNSDMIQSWSNINPLSKKGSNTVNDKYMAILFQAMGGKGNMHDNETKIIKRIIKHIMFTK